MINNICNNGNIQLLKIIFNFGYFFVIVDINFTDTFKNKYYYN
jgi:hypothetical protein